MNSSSHKILGIATVTREQSVWQFDFSKSYCVLIALAILLGHPLISLAKDPSVGNQTNLTFESFLSNSPNLEKAIFDQEMNFPQAFKDSHPDSVFLQHITFKFDKGNFMMEVIDEGFSTDTLKLGRFGGVLWIILAIKKGHEELVLYDPGLNVSNVDFSAPQSAIAAREPSAHAIMTLGISEMALGSCVWDSAIGGFTAESQGLPPVNFHVHLTYNNGVPVSAKYTTPSGKAAEVDYQYSPDFYNGRFPVAFTRYNPTKGKAAQSTTMRINTLNVRASPTTMEDFDPQLLLKDKFKTVGYWSNGVSYTAMRNGRMVPVGTALEADKLAAAMRERRAKHPVAGIRIAIVILILVPVVIVAISLIKKTNKPKLNV